MPIAESYIAMFPNKENDTTKQNIISMALKLSETKDKTGRPAIEVCTKESVMQVAQEVIVKKLDLMKNQGALIVRGNKLMLQSQYQGNVARALELNPFLSHFNFVPIYKNDKVEMEIGKDGSYGIKIHSTSFANIGNGNLIGGYVRAIKKDGSVYMTEVMTMEQIKIAWSKSSNSSLSVHHAFPLRMVRKTILNGLCNWLINTTGEQEEYEEVDYSENNVVNGMEITLDEGQDYSEPSEPEYFQTHSYDSDEEIVDHETDEFDDEEVSDEDWQMAMEEDSRNAVETVSYAKWKNDLKGNGYEMVEGSYDTVNKTVQVRKC
jgi:recombination protein RecT